MSLNVVVGVVAIETEIGTAGTLASLDAVAGDPETALCRRPAQIDLVATDSVAVRFVGGMIEIPSGVFMSAWISACARARL